MKIFMFLWSSVLAYCALVAYLRRRYYLAAFLMLLAIAAAYHSGLWQRLIFGDR